MRAAHTRLMRLLLMTIALTLVAASCHGAPLTIYFKDGAYVTFDTDKIDRMVYASPSGQSAASALPFKFTTVISEEEFEDGLGSAWLPLSAAGGNFDRFAKVRNGFVVVDVPAGNCWGKTGVMSAVPVVTVSADSPNTVIVRVDPAKNDSFVISLSPVLYADTWLQTNLWFHYASAQPGSPAGCYYADAHGAFKYGGTGELRPNTQSVPEWIAITVRPGAADVFIQGEASPATGSFPWMTPGTQLYVHIFSHARVDGGSSLLALDSVTVVK
ncbi:MAG: hypothetical protein VB144_03945 [Clostridia bacterium]|nr:hypothetical protein [Clostridia bacterium]